MHDCPDCGCEPEPPDPRQTELPLPPTPILCPCGALVSIDTRDECWFCYARLCGFCALIGHCGHEHATLIDMHLGLQREKAAPVMDRVVLMWEPLEKLREEVARLWSKWAAKKIEKRVLKGARARIVVKTKDNEEFEVRPLGEVSGVDVSVPVEFPECSATIELKDCRFTSVEETPDAGRQRIDWSKGEPDLKGMKK